MLFWILKAIAYLPLKIIFPTKVIDKKNMPKRGGIVEICNHRRNADTIVVVANQRRRPRVLGKKELFKFFLMRWFLKALGGISVDRKNVKTSSLKSVLKVIKSGKPILIFPEGRRNKTGGAAFLEFKQGAALFALMSKVPIVPMYLKYPPRLFRRNYLFIGESIEFSNYYGKVPTPQILEETSQILTGKLQELQDNANLYNRKTLKNKVNLKRS